MLYEWVYSANKKLFGADDRHGHAARAAAAAGKLGGRHFEDLEALVAENGVGHVVALVNNDLARRDAQRVGAVVPLLTGRGDEIVAAAVDELDVVGAGVLLENVLQLESMRRMWRSVGSLTPGVIS